MLVGVTVRGRAKRTRDIVRTNMKKAVFEIIKKNGDALAEYYENGSFAMELSVNGKVKRLRMYAVNDLTKDKELNAYGGHMAEELLDSGKDVLGEELLKNGEPDFAKVAKILPPITAGAFDILCGAYSYLSGHASWSGVMVDTQNGNVYPQTVANDRITSPVFSPVTVDARLNRNIPYQILLGGKFPFLISVHKLQNEVYEFFMFVEAGDPDRDPVVWIRTKKYNATTASEFEINYQIAARSRLTQSRKIDKDTFLETLFDSVCYWDKFDAQTAEFNIPEKLIERVVGGAMMSAATTFSGDHAHYGHFVYGEEVHDNFPPNYFWALEACCLLGQTVWAKGIFSHLIRFVLNRQGKFFYRQGEEELSGASAAEYGCILFIANRYQKLLGAEAWDSECWEKLIGMGNVILENFVPCQEFDGRRLILMCAEADTNTRIHVYLNNNLWALRGLENLVALLSSYGRSAQADEFQNAVCELSNNVQDLLQTHTVKGTRFGDLPPFRLGYTATPHTLSSCKDTFSRMTDEEFRRYSTASYSRSEGNEGQDLLENSYANYRYYPEMLSSMLLPAEQADAIIKMRENIGGEYLAMNRFLERLDEWTALHNARYLLETERIDKYLLLLYSHTCHHGHPDLMCYYEQVEPGKKWRAHDCVPSLLTTPIMVGWAFAYESVQDKKLSLLKAIPKAWFEHPFGVKNLMYSDGSIDIQVDKDTIVLRFSSPLEREAELVWRKKEVLSKADIAFGQEYIQAIDGNRLVLKKGVSEAKIIIR